ncbi:MAG: hypothetical protein AAGD43_02505 [Pseudomonadota bacterium]
MRLALLTFLIASPVMASEDVRAICLDGMSSHDTVSKDAEEAVAQLISKLRGVPDTTDLRDEIIAAFGVVAEANLALSKVMTDWCRDKL